MGTVSLTQSSINIPENAESNDQIIKNPQDFQESKTDNMIKIRKPLKKPLHA